MKFVTLIPLVLSVAIQSTSGFGVAPLDYLRRIRLDVASSKDHSLVAGTSIHALQQGEQDMRKSLPSWISSIVVATSLMVGASFSNLPFLEVPPAFAEGSKVVGKLQGSGLVFKDTLQIERFEGTIQQALGYMGLTVVASHRIVCQS